MRSSPLHILQTNFEAEFLHESQRAPLGLGTECRNGRGLKLGSEAGLEKTGDNTAED